MAISITIITTANRARRFLQTDAAMVSAILESLKRSSQIFSSKTLIIGPAGQTEAFSSGSIVCLEIEADSNSSAYAPSL